MYNEMSVDGDTAAAFDQYAGDDALDDFVNDAEAQQLIADRGEYVYELFSIMIHSGSAVGGHYYAYIKYVCLNLVHLTTIVRRQR